MAGQIKPLGVQRCDGVVVGTFDLIRDGKPEIQFTMSFGPDDAPNVIAQKLMTKCIQIAEQEPPAALRTIEAAIAAGNVWNLPEPEEKQA